VRHILPTFDSIVDLHWRYCGNGLYFSGAFTSVIVVVSTLDLAFILASTFALMFELTYVSIYRYHKKIQFDLAIGYPLCQTFLT